MTPDFLAVVGTALHGAYWQTPLAADLGIADRTIRRWLAGEYPIPDGVRWDLVNLCKVRANDLSDLAEMLQTPKATP